MTSTSLESKKIKVFTDGSASLPILLQNYRREVVPPTSSWGLCYGNDWFNMCWYMIPPESQLTAGDVKGGILIGDPIPEGFSNGIYMAELQAVVRALMSLPVTWKVTLVLDSKSSIQAVDKYMHCSSIRSKLRMAGRSMLGMIERLVQDRESHGGCVEWVHVKSHSDLIEENSAGNRCADLVAGTSRTSAESLFQPLRLELGEKWLYITQENNQVVSSDVRCCC
jgi:ribonuclease HI